MWQGVALFLDSLVTCARLCVCVCVCLSIPLSVCLSVCICVSMSLSSNIPENRPIPSHSIKDWGVSYLCYFFTVCFGDVQQQSHTCPQCSAQLWGCSFEHIQICAVTKMGRRIEPWGIPKLHVEKLSWLWGNRQKQSLFLYNNSRCGYKTIISLDVLTTTYIKRLTRLITKSSAKLSTVSKKGLWTSLFFC